MCFFSAFPLLVHLPDMAERSFVRGESQSPDDGDKKLGTEKYWRTIYGIGKALDLDSELCVASKRRATLSARLGHIMARL